MDVGKAIIAARGLAGASQGLGATIARNIVGVSGYFFGYEGVRRWLAQGRGVQPEALTPLDTLLAGGCGGLAYWVLCYPLDIIKSAIQTDAIDPAARRYKGGLLGTGAQLWKEGGVKRFTAGLSPCLLRAFPANAAGFVAYEQAVKVLAAGERS